MGGDLMALVAQCSFSDQTHTGSPLWYSTQLGPNLRLIDSCITQLQAAQYVPGHQQPEVNYLPRFSPQLISLEYSSLRLQYSREIDLLENLDIVHITLLVGRRDLAQLLPVGAGVV